MNIRAKLFLILLILALPAAGKADNLVGKWCEDGGPYTCYPPIQNKTDEYTCIESTTITKADANSIQWVINQTIHYYSDGLKNGKTKPEKITRIFQRNTSFPYPVYEHKASLDDYLQQWRLKISNQDLEIAFKQIAPSTQDILLHSKISYQRCTTESAKKQFYTALIDCGGSGDYIAGVPAVVNNPLLWDLGESKANSNSCQVAARCWGGGWVAFAYSEADEISKSAFGAACGGKSRHDAKQQAINSCRQSGGTNCFYEVVSGYDNGNDDLNDNIHKGSKVEFCSNGNCELQGN